MLWIERNRKKLITQKFFMQIIFNAKISRSTVSTTYSMISVVTCVAISKPQLALFSGVYWMKIGIVT